MIKNICSINELMFLIVIADFGQILEVLLPKMYNLIQSKTS